MKIKTEERIRHVEFVSYDGEWPNLCRGVLILKIDGEEVKFGYPNMYKGDKNFESFWESGGSCGFLDDDYSESYCNGGRWIINKSELPEKYQKYVDEIDEVFNENVEYGCCGGCL